MPTLTTLTARVLDRVASHAGDTFYSATRTTLAINTALQQITSEYDWPWLQTTATVTTTAGAASYALPADFLRTDNISRPQTGNQLSRRAVKEMRRFIAQGEPSMYAIYGSALHLRSIPDGVYSFTHDYYRIENTLTAGGDLTLVPDPFADGVVEYAAFLLYRGRKEPDKAADALNAYRMWVKRTQDNVKQSREPIRITVRPGSEF